MTNVRYALIFSFCLFSRFVLVVFHWVGCVDSRGTRFSDIFFCFRRSSWLAVELGPLRVVENVNSAQGDLYSVTKCVLVHGKVPTRQLRSIPIAFDGSWRIRRQTNGSTLSSISKNVRLTSAVLEDAAHPSCNSPNTSRHFVAWRKQRLPGR